MARLEQDVSPKTGARSSYPIVPEHLRVYTIEEGSALPYSTEALPMTQESVSTALLPIHTLSKGIATRSASETLTMATNCPLHAPTCKVDENNTPTRRSTGAEEQDCLCGLGHDTTPTTDNIDSASTSTTSSNRAVAETAGEANQNPKAEPTFLGLPREIRNKIYRYVAEFKSRCGQLISGEVSSCDICKDRTTKESDYARLFAPECELDSEDFATFLKNQGSLCLVSKQMDAEFLEYVVPHYSLDLRFDTQNSQFTDSLNNGPYKSYEQPVGYNHVRVPERFIRLLKRCDVFICENQLWDDQAMHRLSDALEDLEKFQFARVHWTFECEVDRGQKKHFRAVRHVKLEEGTWTGFSRRINVTSLPDTPIEYCEKYFEDYC